MKNSLIHRSSTYIALFALTLGLAACSDDDDAGSVVTPAPAASYSATINMSQKANGNDLVMNTTDLPYTTPMGQRFKVTKMQYLISDITFHKTDGSSFTIEEYNYLDLATNAGLTFSPTTKVPKGDYSSISFTFGFDKEDNTSGAYSDLNTVGWNWPSNPSSMFGDLGGGYHFMRLEGDYIDNMNDTSKFKTHMGTARDTSSTPFTYVDNHITVTLANSAISVNDNFSMTLVMNIEKWYGNQVMWDFNTWNAPIMPTFAAQRALNSNGVDVFTVTIP